MLTAINKQNPTTTTYVASLLLFCMTFLSYGQSVSENFTGFTTNSVGSHLFNGFEMTNAVSSVTASSAPRAVLLGEAANNKLEYVGVDGNGKDEGVGVVSFRYRGAGGSPGFCCLPFPPFSIPPIPAEWYRVRISINGGAYQTRGPLINLNSVAPLVYHTWSFAINEPSDNIKVLVEKITGNGFQFWIDDFSITNFGTPASPTVTWNGSTWIWSDSTPTGTVPSITDNVNVIINGTFDTSGGGIQSSFGGQNLTINTGYDLTVNNGNFVEIEKNVSVYDNATLNVQSQGAFVQRGVGPAAGTFTLSSSGTATSQVNKFTAMLNEWYYYTYWSSPVANANISSTFSTSDRKYWYNAANYLDVSAPFDIDDNGDDWALIPITETQMVIGKGYAATHNNFSMFPNSFQYIFEGSLNTGDYSYPLAYDPANSEHWNLVGNPYPSAISADELFDVNSSAIEAVVYLWSQASPPSNINPGNEVLNFSTSDYVLIADSMSLGNGGDINNDGVINSLDIPSTAIGSGQSFFVVSKDAVDVEFNNFMRISGDNSNDVFYREVSNADTVSETNRLWINLNSDNGAFSQTGIAYVEEATDGLDALGYDTRRNEGNVTAASLYSIIDGVNDTKFAIQSKSANSITPEEVISLGFTNNLTQPTIFTIKALKFEGDFLNSNDIFIKDNLLNITHNLKASDYTFTSDAGEFNERFEIVFTTDALSIDENVLDANALTITELTDTDVAFNVGKAFSISNVKIFDLLGRQIYDLEGSSNREVYNLAKLSKAAYIAKVTLDNGQVISKKAIKQK